jgi:hypothetical protein
MEKERSIVELGDKVYAFFHEPFNSEVDMDDLTMIHYHNIVGEIITIPTLMNRVGILKADADNAFRETKLAHKILEAERSEYYRKKLTTEVNSKVKLPTITQVEDAVIQDEQVMESQLGLFKMQKQAEQIDSLYWAVKSKEMKLNQLSQNLTPSDFESEIIEESINGVLIKLQEKKF